MEYTFHSVIWPFVLSLYGPAAINGNYLWNNYKELSINFILDEKTIEMALSMQTQNPEWENFCLRVYLAGKGCDGFDYGVCFDKKEDDDVVQQCGALTLISDTETVKFVDGSSIIWTDDDRGKGFLVENPKHKKFRGKFFKRKNWEQNLNL